MPSVQTKLFKSNKSQAVSLPKAIAFPDSVTNVEIIAIGNKRIITPAAHSWDDWFDSPGVFDDFMTERLQPEDQRREMQGQKKWILVTNNKKEFTRVKTGVQNRIKVIRDILNVVYPQLFYPSQDHRKKIDFYDSVGY